MARIIVSSVSDVIDRTGAHRRALAGPVIGELTKHLAKSGDPDRIRFDGSHHNIRAFRTKLATYQRRLAEFTKRYPREAGEKIADFAIRLRESHPDIAHVLSTLSDAAAWIARFEKADADERKRVDAEREADKQRRHHALVAASEPDDLQVQRLLATIERASSAEIQLHALHVALTRHGEAQRAREAIERIFGAAEDARADLNLEPLDRPSFALAPEGAPAMAELFAAATAWRR